MMRVTVDAFSGVSNPQWVLEESDANEILRNITRHRDVIADVGAGFDGLGFRGVILEPLGDDESQAHDVPAMFKIGVGSGNDGAGLELAERLIRSMPKQAPHVAARGFSCSPTRGRVGWVSACRCASERRGDMLHRTYQVQPGLLESAGGPAVQQLLQLCLEPAHRHLRAAGEGSGRLSIWDYLRRGDALCTGGWLPPALRLFSRLGEEPLPGRIGRRSRMGLPLVSPAYARRGFLGPQAWPWHSAELRQQGCDYHKPGDV
jgi:hypothetical protein